MKTTFYGVRGSVAAPLTAAQLSEKISRALITLAKDPVLLAKFLTLLTSLDGFGAAEQSKRVVAFLEEHLPFELYGTYGGNTTCLAVRCGDLPMILDMGTGMRPLGNAMMPEVFANGGINGVVLTSHSHWDHIQGMPFFGPLFMSRKKFKNEFKFCGGKAWDSQIDIVLAGQMSAPYFPVTLAEIRQTRLQMETESVYDEWESAFQSSDGKQVKVLARTLNHPQDTFGYRLEYGGQTIAWTTDHEPYGAGIPLPLLDLVQDADLWITDCQYTLDMYTGKKGGVQRHGWGHSYPEYIAEVARTAKPGRIVTIHHDPSADDLLIEEIAAQVEQLSGIKTTPAYEGLVIDL